MNAFRRSFDDFNRADTIILSPSIPDIVFSGLKTLNDLIPLKFTDPP